MESTIHPNDVKVGDILTVRYRGESIDITVTSEPTYDENDGYGAYWSCSVKHSFYPKEWFITWNEENPVWEIGKE